MPRILSKVATVCFLMAGLGVCRADLGDTEAQCIARFGNESEVQNGLGYDKVGDKAADFHAKRSNVPLTIHVIFLNGKVCHEKITSEDVSKGLTEDQMKALLDAEGGIKSWHKHKTIFRTDRRSWDTAGAEDWVRTDGAMARFWIGGKASSLERKGEMELSTKQYADAQAYYDKQDGAE